MSSFIFNILNFVSDGNAIKQLYQHLWRRVWNSFSLSFSLYVIYILYIYIIYFIYTYICYIYIYIYYINNKIYIYISTRKIYISRTVKWYQHRHGTTKARAKKSWRILGKKFKKLPHGFNAELNFLNPNISAFFAHLLFWKSYAEGTSETQSNIV